MTAEITAILLREWIYGTDFSATKESSIVVVVPPAAQRSAPLVQTGASCRDRASSLLS
jgi:hypothetical protein